MTETLVWQSGLRVPFRGLTSRDGMLIKGSVGWGEFSPFWDYSDGAAARWRDCALEQANLGWPEPVRESIPVNVIIPAAMPNVAKELVAISGGCQTAKVKVAAPSVVPPGRGFGMRSSRSSTDSKASPAPVESIDTEVARIAAVREALDDQFGPGVGKIRVDANGAWTVPEAVEHLRELHLVAGGLEYAEQPCATVEELAELRTALHRAKVPVLIAADESIRRAADPYRVRDLAAADIVVLKVAPLGGVQACLRLASDIGLPVVVSSALESSIGLAAGLALAGALPSLPFACGLATASLLTHDVVAHPLLPINGHLPVLEADHPRLTPMPNSATPDAELTAKWDSRAKRVAALPHRHSAASADAR